MEITSAEEEEDLEEEAKHKETLKALNTLVKRFKNLFGEVPADGLSIAEIQDKILKEMKRRGLRPYKL